MAGDLLPSGAGGLLAWPGRLLGKLFARRLRAEVEVHLPVLRVVRSQLGETARQVEQAVVEVCNSFGGMAGRASETVARASGLLHGVQAEGDGQAGVEALIEVSRTTIVHLLERTERNTAVSLNAVRRMEEVEAAMRRMTGTVGEVDKIAFSSGLLALNAKIQAVHVGEQGTGFGVVADEISAHARRSAELTDQIRETIRGLSLAVAAAAAELRTMAEADRGALEASRREAGAALDGLRRSHEETRNSLAEVAGRSRQLADEIARAVTALQFQDRVTQRLAHAAGALESVESAFHRSLGGEPGEGDEDRRRKVVEDLKRSYTMQPERAVLGRVTGVAEAEAEAEAAGEVELF